MKLWLKICGVRRSEDARAAVEAGADALGVNFYPPSKRYATVEQAREVVAAVPEGFPVYGVFVDLSREEILETVAATGINGIQLHGGEPLYEALGYELPVIVARKVTSPIDQGARTILTNPVPYRNRVRLLLDSPVGGGSGTQFDQEVMRDQGFEDFSTCIVAGGLTPTNVGGVVAAMRPFGVDTAGGVETEPGIKDSTLIKEFIRNARTA